MTLEPDSQAREFNAGYGSTQVFKTSDDFQFKLPHGFSHGTQKSPQSLSQLKKLGYDVMLSSNAGLVAFPRANGCVEPASSSLAI